MEPIIYIIDDDQSMVESLSWVIESIGFKAKVYTTAHAFLTEHDPKKHGCIILDVCMQGMSGPELQRKLKDKFTPALPIIFISGHGDVPLAVKVMKSGAVDFLLKPCNDHVLLESINKALRIDKYNREISSQFNVAKERFTLLSSREIQVMRGIIDGKSNKIVSNELQISLKTVEAHRASLMKKMMVKSVPDLVKLAYKHHMLTEPSEFEMN